MKPNTSPKVRPTTKKPAALNNSFSYIKKGSTSAKPIQKPGVIETPRFKVQFNFTNDMVPITSTHSVDVPKEYFSFGENSVNSIELEPSIEKVVSVPRPSNSPLNGKVSSTLFKKHTKNTRSTTETTDNNEKPAPYKSGYFNPHHKSQSFHMQKQGTPTKLRPDKKLDKQKSDSAAPQKHIQIFNNNYNIINISDPNTKEKRDSLKSLQKQFQQILQTQQLLETKPPLKKNGRTTSSFEKTKKKAVNTSSDSIFPPKQ